MVVFKDAEQQRQKPHCRGEEQRSCKPLFLKHISVKEGENKILEKEGHMITETFSHDSKQPRVIFKRKIKKQNMEPKSKSNKIPLLLMKHLCLFVIKN